MAADPNPPGPVDIEKLQPAGETERAVKPPKNDFALATGRHIETLERQCDHLLDKRAELEREIARHAAQLLSLSAANARLEAENRHSTENLVSERLERGSIGVLSAVLTAIGGGMVSVYTDWRRPVFGLILAFGCLLMLFNSIFSFTREKIRARFHPLLGLASSPRLSEDQSRGPS